MNVHEPWLGAMAPFRMYGNLYFVGTSPASTHLIDTGDGLLILDSGYQESLYLMLENVRSLGFRPSDIRWILHSHGHVDHAGATRALLEMFHPETYIGAPDAPIVTGERPLTWAPEYNMHFSTFEPDVQIQDGDVLRFGNTEVQCLASPGHTIGTFSFFWNVTGEDGRTLRAGTMGGAGVNTMASQYIHRYHLEEEDWRGAFAKTLERCRRERVDVFVGNHVHHNQTPERYARLCAGERDAFVDAGAWGKFLDDSEKKYREMLAADPL